MFCRLAFAAAAFSAVVQGAAVRMRSSSSGVKVTFKETTICETTPGVKAYSGYVTLPATLDARMPYESNLFFWFFEARRSPATAPLTLWLQGGPGAATTEQAVNGHNGPCIVNADSETTRLNPHSWNEVSNVIYLDQTVQTGFSHDGELRDGVLHTDTGLIDVDQTDGTATPGWLAVKGTFPSQDQSRMVNTTLTAARAVYHFMQAFFDEFEQYRRDRVNIWSQSYGGQYAPAIASLINDEKKRVEAGGGSQVLNKCGEAPRHVFGVESVGIINGHVDMLAQMQPTLDFGNNNTYGIRSYPDEVARSIESQMYGPGGCLELALACRRLQDERDPDGVAADAELAAACTAASLGCWSLVYQHDEAASHYTFDIAQPLPVGFPRGYELGWLNSAATRAALGVPLNYTRSTYAVAEPFLATGDLVRSASAAIGLLLDDGVRVALVYGDRDWRCSWPSGEAVSLTVPHAKSAEFAAAGYEDLTVGGRAVGKVRQYGNLSFSRVYNAGHAVPIYKPAEALEVLRRTLQGKDVATGQVDAAAYSSKGPSQVFDVRFAAEPVPEAECYVLDAPIGLSCTPAQVAALRDNTAVVKNFIVVEPTA